MQARLQLLAPGSLAPRTGNGLTLLLSASHSLCVVALDILCQVLTCPLLDVPWQAAQRSL